MSRVLVTGATGFVGRGVVPRLRQAGHTVRAAVRGGPPPPHLAEAEVVHVPEVGPETDWSAALRDVDAVVHLAGRVHVMRETAPDPLAEFRRTNVAGSARLAEAAAAAGVRRFVFVSSAKVGGEATPPGSALDERAPPAPEGPYARSKAEAEEALAAAFAGTSVRWAALRSPLVYGPEVRANFLELMRLCDSGLPLPLAAVDNSRSLIGRRNLADAIGAVLEVADLENGPYYVADGEDVSTPELVRRLARSLHRPARLFPVPPGMLRATAGLAGRRSQADRLLQSLRLDTSRFRRRVGWTPPVSMIKGLQETADWYRGTNHHAN